MPAVVEAADRDSLCIEFAGKRGITAAVLAKAMDQQQARAGLRRRPVVEMQHHAVASFESRR